MAEIRFTRRALHDVRKLTPAVRQRMEIALDELIETPRADDQLHGEWEGYWKRHKRENQRGRNHTGQADRQI